MQNERQLRRLLSVGDHVRIVGGRSGRIENIDGDELQIALDGGGTVFKLVYAVDLITHVHISRDTK